MPLLHRSETWAVWVADIRRLSVFNNRCLRSISGGRQLTWQLNMKKITKDQAVTRACRLPRWGPCDFPSLATNFTRYRS